jgi:hypothetical protein
LGANPVEVLRHVPANEGKLTITNETPGVERLRVVVNGRQFALADLKDGETRTLDVSGAMQAGDDNRIMLIAYGSRGGSAVVLVSDS